jgi:hypothetical protein
MEQGTADRLLSRPVLSAYFPVGRDPRSYEPTDLLFLVDRESTWTNVDEEQETAHDS